jgi:putative Mg2+ transporter-C (MgtC) family protein
MSVWDQIATTAENDFGDLNVIHATQLVARLLVAGVLGGILGWERTHAGKPAGFRTHILVALGAAAFVAIPQQSGFSVSEISRIIQGLVTGIGFLGAGCIMKADNEGHVKGLTTAAGIWTTSAVGVAAGLGHVGSAILLAVLGWITLDQLARFEHRIPNKPVA